MGPIPPSRPYPAARLLPLLFLLCAAGAFLPVPPFLRIACAAPLVFFLPGRVAMTVFGLRHGPREDDAFLPLMLSPLALSLVALALVPVTPSIPVAFRLSVLLFLALSAGLALLPARAPAERLAPLPGGVVVVSLGFGLLLLLSFLANPYLLVRMDSFYHAAVIGEIKAHGIPPLEPRLPDVPIKYYWLYHFFLYGWMELSGVTAFWAMLWFTLVNALAFPYLAARFSRVFTVDRVRLVATALFAVAGLGVAAWVLVPVVWLLELPFGAVTGSAALQLILSRIEFDSFRVIYTLTPAHTSLVNALDKYYTLTSFTYSIGLFLLATIAVLSPTSFQRGRLRSTAFLLLLFVGNFLFQILTGTALLMMAWGAAALLLVRGWRDRAGRPGWITLALPAVAVASAVLVLPYVRSLGSVGQGGGAVRQFVHFGLDNLLTMIVACVATLPFSLRAVRRLLAARAEPWPLAAAWAVSLFVVAVFFDAGGMAEVKLAFLFLQLLLPFVVWEFLDELARPGRLRRTLLGAWMVVLFAVPAVLTVRGFLLDRPANAIEERQFGLTAPDFALLDWIRRNTPPDAVVAEHPEYCLAPVYAERRELYSNFSSMWTFGYDDARTARYRAIHAALYSTGPVRPEDLAYLRARGLDVYVVVWDVERAAHPEIAARLEALPGDFSKVHESPSGVVYRLKR